MNREIWTGLLLVVIAAILGLWFFRGYVSQLSEPVFRVYSIENNALFISDADIRSYNWTSQEMAITPEASERLTALDDLYSWTGFVIKIDGEEIYRGIFREYTMSATPAPPRISILYPSASFPFESGDYEAIRMFWPFFQPPSDQPLNNAKIFDYFEKINKLEYSITMIRFGGAVLYYKWLNPL